jgi:hypothetical protein
MKRRRLDIIPKVTDAYAATTLGLMLRLTKAGRQRFKLSHQRVSVTVEAIILRNAFGHWGLQIIAPTTCLAGNSLIFDKVRFEIREQGR